MPWDVSSSWISGMNSGIRREGRTPALGVKTGFVLSLLEPARTFLPMPTNLQIR